MSSYLIKNFAIGILLFIGITAIFGGVSLIITNGLGTTVPQLHGYFQSFAIPGLMLFLVGAINIGAAWLLIIHHKFQYELITSAALGMLIYEVSELYIVQYPHWLQLFYSALSITLLIFIMLLLRRNYD
jgi:hypothetical protein